jgi:hypothetical protein
MSNSMEEEAGKLLVCAQRINKGHLSLEIMCKFRSLSNGHVFERLAPADREVVCEAAEIIYEKYAIKTLPLASIALRSKVG